jgi:uncharacterized membrane protein YdjX (TVP38/TMEM64 family)
VPDAAVIDPERPLVSDELVRDFVLEHEEKPMRGRLVTLGAMICVIAILAAAWRWTPLRDWLDLNALIAFADRIDDLPGTPLLVLLAYVVAGLLVVPLTILIAATGIAFGPVFGVIYALAGGLLSGFVSYMIGRKLGPRDGAQLAGERLNAISRKLAERGLLAVVLVRMVPVAPVHIVNIVAGASHINLRDFLLGTFIGLLPGVLGIVVFVDRIIATVRNPGFVTFALLASSPACCGGARWCCSGGSRGASAPRRPAIERTAPMAVDAAARVVQHPHRRGTRRHFHPERIDGRGARARCRRHRAAGSAARRRHLRHARASRGGDRLCIGGGPDADCTRRTGTTATRS